MPQAITNRGEVVGHGLLFPKRVGLLGDEIQETEPMLRAVPWAHAASLPASGSNGKGKIESHFSLVQTQAWGKVCQHTKLEIVPSPTPLVYPCCLYTFLFPCSVYIIFPAGLLFMPEFVQERPCWLLSGFHLLFCSFYQPTRNTATAQWLQAFLQGVFIGPLFFNIVIQKQVEKWGL